jgi:RimJ/RimL family protein N-acetyltransferase
MHIRRLTPADAAVFQQLRLAALQESPAAFGSSYEEERDFSQAIIEDRLKARPDRGTFGAFEGTELVGLIALGRERHRKLEHKALIWGMYVVPKARRSGIGRALLLAALELARSVTGIRQVNLCVNANNSEAIDLYKSAGFEVFGLEQGAMLIDGELHDEVHMSLHLSADNGARPPRTGETKQ